MTKLVKWDLESHGSCPRQPAKEKAASVARGFDYLVCRFGLSLSRLHLRDPQSVGWFLEVPNQAELGERPDEVGAGIKLIPATTKAPVGGRAMVVGMPRFPDRQKRRDGNVENPSEVGGEVVSPFADGVPDGIHHPRRVILDDQSHDTDNEKSAEPVAEQKSDKSRHHEGHQDNEPAMMLVIPADDFVLCADFAEAHRVLRWRSAEALLTQKPAHV